MPSPAPPDCPLFFLNIKLVILFKFFTLVDNLPY